jgi:hypothetical protein
LPTAFASPKYEVATLFEITTLFGQKGKKVAVSINHSLRSVKIISNSDRLFVDIQHLRVAFDFWKKIHQRITGIVSGFGRIINLTFHFKNRIYSKDPVGPSVLPVIARFFHDVDGNEKADRNSEGKAEDYCKNLKFSAGKRAIKCCEDVSEHSGRIPRKIYPSRNGIKNRPWKTSESGRLERDNLA